MKANTQTASVSILRTLNILGKKFKTKKDSERLLVQFETELKVISDYLNASQREAFMFSTIFWLNCNEHSSIDVSDISRFFQCDFIDVLVFQSEVELLTRKKILIRKRNGNSSSMNIMKYNFSINPLIMDAILNNDPLPVIKAMEQMDIYQFVGAVSDLIDDRSKADLSAHDLFEMVEELEKENQHLSMVTHAQKLKLNIDDRTLWYEMCDDLINSGKSGLECTLKDIYDRVYQRLQKSRQIITKKNKLFELEWIELEESTFISDAIIALSEKGRELFLGEDASMFLTNTKNKKLINSEDIVEKALYFDENLDKQVGFLRESMTESMFESLQTRLESKGLPKGLSAIFYGGPGTGKTESVYQLARQTGRSILHVDISQSKSMWFGESEKRIKEIFTNYKSFCKSESIKPILLFNEADAIFGKRKDGNASNVAQTENAIQNIILEEMEKLDGILIATTNLNENLDAAFERRFLFKVKFEKPSLEAKQKIWQSKLDWLTEADAKHLAANYSFSGGEIENIVRKTIMEEVLNGDKPEMSQLIVYCDAEKFTSRNGSKKFGF